MISLTCKRIAIGVWVAFAVIALVSIVAAAPPPAKEGNTVVAQDTTIAFTSPKLAPAATAPGLSVSNGVCMGSTSAGVSGPWGGVSLGSNWKDEDCNIRYFAGMAEGMGLHEVAVTLLSRNEMFAQALRLNNVPFVQYKADTVDVSRDNGGFVDPEGASD